MRKAYDNILSDYVDAEIASIEGGSEPYRYVCACCWEEVHLCAVDSFYQVAHFRHRNGNNDVNCENYLGSRNAVINNANTRLNAKDKVDFFLDIGKSIFTIGVRFSSEEIAVFEKNQVKLEVRSTNQGKPFLTHRVDRSTFAPDIITHFALPLFSWDYFVCSTNDTKKRRYEVFSKNSAGNSFPIFFRNLTISSDENPISKLVKSKNLYTNTTYTLVTTNRSPSILRFDESVIVDNKNEFRTMNQDFISATILIKTISAQTAQKLNEWGYSLEANETLNILWPPSAISNERLITNRSEMFLYSSFVLSPHGNINLSEKSIQKINSNVSLIQISDGVKVYKKNNELFIAKMEIVKNEYSLIRVAEKFVSKFTADDNGYYLFDKSGVTRLSKGMTITLSKNSKILHFYFNYLDQVIAAKDTETRIDAQTLLSEILQYYKRVLPYKTDNFGSLKVSEIAYVYTSRCEQTGFINAAVIRYIQGGGI